MTLKRLVLKEGQNIPETIYTFYISELLTLEKGSGNWTTGYVQPKGTNDLIIFMNIYITKNPTFYEVKMHLFNGMFVRISYAYIPIS